MTKGGNDQKQKSAFDFHAQKKAAKLPFPAMQNK
jgi:hypothetical protein